MDCSDSRMMMLEEVCVQTICTNLLNAPNSQLIDLSKSELSQDCIRKIFDHLNSPLCEDQRSDHLFNRIKSILPEYLDLSSWKLQHATFMQIAFPSFQPQLRHLALSPSSFGSQSITQYAIFSSLNKIIASHPALISIDLVRFSFLGGVLKGELTPLLNQLECVALIDCTGVNVNFLEDFLPYLPGLRKLIIEGDPDIQQVEIPPRDDQNQLWNREELLGGYLGIDEPLILEYQIGPEDFDEPQPNFEFAVPAAKCLTLKNATVMNSEFEELLVLLPGLKKLTLVECDEINIENAIPTPHTNIEYLEIYNSYVPAEIFIKLLQMFPNLKELHLEEGNFSRQTLEYILIYGISLTKLTFKGFRTEEETGNAIIEDFARCLQNRKQYIEWEILLDLGTPSNFMTQALPAVGETPPE